MDSKLLKLLLRRCALDARALIRQPRQHAAPVLLQGVRQPTGSHTATGKRALLSYMRDAFLPGGTDPRGEGHQNLQRTRMLADMLAARGYTVDAVHHRAGSVALPSAYDLVVGLGPTMLALPQTIHDRAVTLFIMTGCIPSRNNQLEQQRLDDLLRRRHAALRPRRLATWPDEALSRFDAIAYIGNDWTREGIAPHNPRLYPFPNHHTCGGDAIPLPPRDMAHARSSFLFLASGGQVHRGLDLLLEAFAAEPSCHLHICAPLHAELDFVWHYRRELFQTPNIHPWGWMRTHSEAFRALSASCAYVILPSCAEGQPGSVTMAMHQGLVPIVSEACGLDLYGSGTILSDCSVPALRETIRTHARKPVTELEQESRSIRHIAGSHYSETSFRTSWNVLLDDVLRIGKAREP